MWGIGLCWGKTHLWPSFLYKFCFSGPAGLQGARAACGSFGAVKGTWQGWKCQQLSWWSNLQSFGLEMQKSCSSPHASHQAGTCCWCCFSALGKAQCPNGSRQSFVFPATAPCPECQQSKPFRRVTGISFVPHFADIPCLLFLSQPGSMFSQAMKKWVQGNTDEVCPISCSSCDFTLQRNKVLMFLILAVISEYLFAAARTGRFCVLNIIWLHVCVKLVCSLPVLAGWTN